MRIQTHAGYTFNFNRSEKKYMKLSVCVSVFEICISFIHLKQQQQQKPSKILQFMWRKFALNELMNGIKFHRNLSTVMLPSVKCFFNKYILKMK